MRPLTIDYERRVALVVILVRTWGGRETAVAQPLVPWWAAGQ